MSEFVRKHFTLITDMAYGNKSAIYKYLQIFKSCKNLRRVS